ncbi:MAG: protein kinase [Terriglobales bacterium]|jgi:serine/threonine protein kinase/tetratricopeptide (TPR) repeat protein
MAKSRIVSHYEIIEEIGRGGMGIVYKGRDRLLNRDVALKALPFAKSIEDDPQHSVLRQRFEREAQSASALNHPNIVTIYDLLSEPDGDFIVMEYVEGKPLSKAIPRNGLPLAQVLRYGLQIADAVGSAHAAGIVHRDLKPENILISRSDQIKIVDFGLAKQGSDERGVLPTQEMLTSPGSFMGTLCYAAPEQHLNLPVDQRTDIFALGVVLFKMLTGELPFYGKNLMELVQAINRCKPRSLRALRPAAPPILDALIARALQREPADRYPNVGELAADLKLAGEVGEHVTLAGASISQAELNSSVDTRISSGSSSFAQPPVAGREKISIAVLPFRSLSENKEDSYMAMGIGSEINSALSRVPGVRVASHLATYRYKDNELPDLSRIASELKIRYVLTGSLRRGGNRIRVIVELADVITGSVQWSRTYDRDLEDLFAVQEEIASAIVRATGGELIRAGSERADKASADELDAWGLVRKAYHFWNYGFHPAGIGDSLNLLRRALELDPNYANAHAFLGLYLIERVALILSEHPEEDRAEAQAAVDRAFELAPNDTEVLENAGLVWCHCGMWERSVQALRRAVKISPFNLVAWGYLGFVLGCGGQQTKNATEGDRILTKLITDTPEHPSVPYWYFFKAMACTRLGHFEEAVTCAFKCVEMHPNFYIARYTLANALGHVGRYDEARAEMATALTINPHLSEPLMTREWVVIIRDRQLAETQLAGLRKAGIFPQLLTGAETGGEK